jgi:hypothetical protein
MLIAVVSYTERKLVHRQFFIFSDILTMTVAGVYKYNMHVNSLLFTMTMLHLSVSQRWL